MKLIIFFILLTTSIFSANFPVLDQGRFRSFEVVAKTHFKEKNFEKKLWEAHFLGDFPLLCLQSKHHWICLSELENSKHGFLYSSKDLTFLKELYVQIKKDFKNNQIDHAKIEQLNLFLNHYYIESVASKIAIESSQILKYPKKWQLDLESFYFLFPWVKLVLILYGLSFITFIFSKKNFGFLFLFTGILLHFLLLLSRSLILQRPPVSNMQETMLYVPFVIICIGIIFYNSHKSQAALLFSLLSSFCVLGLIEVCQMDQSLQNVQPVLNSNFWLVIHVLMIVASYGLFILAGFLGHFYLIQTWLKRKKETELPQFILKFIYIGLTLLIPGTILGGIWAAQSWGRFWDWDPKESWAFISAGCYLIVVHAYRYKKIQGFGLAIGSIIGLIAISFTWYGVNYILAVGLHSYGFGKGSQLAYYIFLIGEVIFIASSFIIENKRRIV